MSDTPYSNMTIWALEQERDKIVAELKTRYLVRGDAPRKDRHPVCEADGCELLLPRHAAAPEGGARIDRDELNRLIVEYGNSQFDCGEHGGDDEKPEPYEKVHARAIAAREALDAYLRRAMNGGGKS